MTPKSAGLTLAEPPIDAASLAAALPLLTDKLAALKATLDHDQQAVLGSIVTSAGRHLRELQGLGAATGPLSAAAPAMRTELLNLPDTLGFTGSTR
ncbi:hypothetical protein LG634_01125 [Streptomyces bambusae]|uniref:hypothetical protein n=1 Tax=Streptomyces bambusae TaxID=1550616 RepID=UPI001CFDEA2E|nr:hypothetical protein [Streptomyces bambusae]MCB5163455.1 hypothetical protein [Streptomyces bambusae]